MHLNLEGKYAEAITHYTTVFSGGSQRLHHFRSAFSEGPYSVDRKFAEVVWDVVAEVST